MIPVSMVKLQDWIEKEATRRCFGRPTSSSDQSEPRGWRYGPNWRRTAKNLEIYVGCLARLSEFTDYEGSFWCLRENAMQHPKLEEPLIDKLVVIANPRHHFQDGLRSAATKVLNNYELDMEGNPVKSPSSATVLWSISTVLKSKTTLILNINRRNSHDLLEQGYSIPNLQRPLAVTVDTNTRVEPAYSSGEIEEMKTETGDA